MPLSGSLTCHSEPAGGSPPNHGGNAGLSVAMVSLPAVFNVRLSGAQASAEGVGAGVAGAAVAGAGVGVAPAPVHALTTRTSAVSTVVRRNPRRTMSLPRT